MKFKKILSSFILAIAFAFTVAPIVSADFNLVGADGKAVTQDVDQKKIEAGTGQVILYMGIAFGIVVSIGISVTAIAMSMGKREWVAQHLINIVAGVLLFAFGASAAGAVIAKLS